jgi:hypothetical protein
VKYALYDRPVIASLKNPEVFLFNYYALSLLNISNETFIGECGVLSDFKKPASKFPSV